jgi:signal transduction histidine kinase
MKTIARTLKPTRLALVTWVTLAALSALSALGAGAANAAGATATKDEAVAMVKKGVAFLKANGADKAYAEISNAKGSFVDRDLYLVAYTLEGKCVAHGANPKQVGRDLLELTDIDGKFFVKDRVAMVKAKPAGAWQEYKFTNPVSKKIEPKVMYCEKAGEVAICGGVYP